MSWLNLCNYFIPSLFGLWVEWNVLVGYLQLKHNRDKCYFHAMLGSICLSIHQIIERRKKSLQINFDKPGIITSNIDAVAGTHNAQQTRYELCLDGKRLTVGFGSTQDDVDLSIWTRGKTNIGRKEVKTWNWATGDHMHQGRIRASRPHRQGKYTGHGMGW